MALTGVDIYYDWCLFEKNDIDTGPRQLPVQRHYFGYSLMSTCHKSAICPFHTLQSICSVRGAGQLAEHVLSLGPVCTDAVNGSSDSVIVLR